MAGINVNGIGRNPYADSYLTSAKNRSNTTSKNTFVNAVKKVEESKNSADTSNVMYPGDVTIDYPPRINNAVNNSVVSEKSKEYHISPNGFAGGCFSAYAVLWRHKPFNLHYFRPYLFWHYLKKSNLSHFPNKP